MLFWFRCVDEILNATISPIDSLAGYSIYWSDKYDTIGVLCSY